SVRSTQLSIVALSLAALAACRTDPPPSSQEIRDEAVPELIWPEEWEAGSTPGSVQDDWLAKFADPELEALVHEALSRNLDLRIAAARGAPADAYAEAAKAALRPA